MSGYYTPSGVPQTNSKAASAAVRTEFQSISTAFSLFPTLPGNAGRAFVVNGSGDAVVLTVGQLSLAGNLTTSGALTTTGAFSTVFAQTASVTLTLPAVTSTLATTTSVSTETTRALAAEALLAPLASPALTGTPTVPTAAPGNNTTIAASTAFVTAAVVAATTGVASFNARTGAVTLQASDVTGVGGALLASPAFSGNPTAPTASAGDNDTSIATTAFVTAAVAPAFNDVGRNLLHNSLCLIQQRGGSPFTATGYTLDRWKLSIAGSDVASVVQGTISDSWRGQIGDESATSALTNTFSGSSSAPSATAISQPIESVRRVSGKTVTLSFWAVAGSGSPKFGASIDQIFGTGGSPSSTVQGAGQSVTLSTTMAPYQLVFVVPTAIGQTFGTTVGTDFTQLNFWYSSGSNNATRSGSVGVQSNTISVWGMQFEIGSRATPLEKLDYNLQIAQCKRFCRLGFVETAGYSATGGAIGSAISLGDGMRGVPTVVLSSQGYVNASGATVAYVDANTLVVVADVTSTGGAVFDAVFLATADF